VSEEKKEILEAIEVLETKVRWMKIILEDTVSDDYKNMARKYLDSLQELSEEQKRGTEKEVMKTRVKLLEEDIRTLKEKINGTVLL